MAGGLAEASGKVVARARLGRVRVSNRVGILRNRRSHNIELHPNHITISRPFTSSKLRQQVKGVGHSIRGAVLHLRTCSRPAIVTTAFAIDIVSLQASPGVEAYSLLSTVGSNRD